MHYREEQVHILPGFPRHIVSAEFPVSLRAVRIALYVNFPPGVIIGSNNTVHKENLIKALNTTRNEIEKALGVRILLLTRYQDEPEPTTPSVETKKDDINSIIIGVSVAAFVLLILLVCIIVV